MAGLLRFTMNAIPVNVTDFSSGLSEFLNQVQYKGQVLDIERGKKVIARVSPASVVDGYPIDQLDKLIAGGPQLSAAERLSFAKDVQNVRSRLSKSRDPWAS
jgi:hypothetical protein